MTVLACPHHQVLQNLHNGGSRQQGKSSQADFSWVWSAILVVPELLWCTGSHIVNSSM